MNGKRAEFRLIRCD